VDEVLEFVDAFVAAAPGCYRLANHFRRVPPRSKPGAIGAHRWSSSPVTPRQHSEVLIPADDSDYWAGVGYWLSNDVVGPTRTGGPGGKPSKDQIASLSIAFERSRSRYEYCDEEYRIGFGTLNSNVPGQPRSPQPKTDISGWIRYCAEENRRLD